MLNKKTKFIVFIGSNTFIVTVRTFVRVLVQKNGRIIVNDANKTCFKNFLLKLARLGDISYSSKSLFFIFKKTLFAFSFLETPLNYTLIFFGLPFQKSMQYSLYKCLPSNPRVNIVSNFGGLQCQNVPFKPKYCGDFVRFYSLFLLLKLSRARFFVLKNINSDVEVSLFYRTHPVVFRIQGVKVSSVFSELDRAVFKIMFLCKLLGYTNWSFKGLNLFFGILGARNFLEHNYSTSLSRSVYRTLSKFFNNKRLDAF